MNELWNPSFWSGLSGPAVAILVCVAFVWALVTERLVIGRQYRAAVARADKAEETRDALTGELMSKNASDEAMTGIIAALRREVAESKGQG